MIVRHVLRRPRRVAACIAAVALQAAHATDPNLLPNGTFDASAGGVGWTNVGSGGAGYVSHPDVANSATSGSFEVTNSTGRSSCFRLTPNAAFSFGASYTGENLFGATSDGGMTCYAYASSDCSGSAQTLAHIDMPYSDPWVSRSVNGTLPSTAGSGNCELSDTTTFIPTYKASTWFDNVFFDSTAAAPIPVKLDGYLSGNWYDPDQSGHGFQLEFTGQNDTLLAIWYVYAPSGGAQNWIFAQGTFDPSKNSVTIPAVLLEHGAFPPLFNPADVTRTPWGTLTFAFSDCNHATVSWSSTLPGYGTGSLPLNRLSHIEGTVCPQ